MSPRTPPLLLCGATLAMLMLTGPLTLAAVAAPESSPLTTAPPQAPVDVLDYRGDPARDGVMPGPGPTGPETTVRWTYQASGPIISQVAVAAGDVLLLSSEGTVHDIDVASGRERWSVSIGAPALASPLVLGDRLLIGASDGVHAMQLDDGHEVWRTGVTDQVRGSPVPLGDRVAVAADDGTVTALDATTGTVAWVTALGGEVDSSPAATDDMFVVGTRRGEVVALAPDDGTVLWRTDTGDGLRVGTPAIVDGRVLVATLSAADSSVPVGKPHIRALDLATGSVEWTFDSPDGVPSYTPAVLGDLAISMGKSGVVTALDMTTGTIAWQVSVPGKLDVVPAVSGGVVYGATINGVAFALDASGATLWEVPIRGVPYGATVTGGLMLVGTDLGTLYAIWDPA